MTTLTLGILLGLVGGLGLTGLIYVFVPPGLPHLGDAVARMTPQRSHYIVSTDTDTLPLLERLGNRSQDHLRNIPGFKIPAADLRLLEKTSGWFVGRKIFAAAFGLALPSLLSATLVLIGVPLPLGIPVVVGLAFAVFFWFIPDLEVNGKAQEARDEYGIAVTVYIELVHLEKLAGLDAARALKEAAQIGNSRIFRRLSEELQRAEFNQVSAWTALRHLSEELQLPELADLAEIMTSAGVDGVAVADTLQARAQDLRNAQLSREQAKAEAATERMTGPQSLLAIVFCLLLITPPMMRVFLGG
jgi:tight adherence protein C